MRVAVAEGSSNGTQEGRLSLHKRNPGRSAGGDSRGYGEGIFSARSRERLILKLAGIAGMRPGEILALQ
jgi:hypothetical protein